MDEKQITFRQIFIDYLKAKSLAYNSIKTYLKFFDKFDPILMKQSGTDYLIGFINSNNSCVCRAFLKHLLELIKRGNYFSEEFKSIARDFEVPKVSGRKKQRQIQIITREEVSKLAKAMATHRNKMIVYATYYLGLRLSELLSLRVSSFDFEKRSCRVIGKGNKERIIPIYPRLQVVLIEYINENVEKNPDFDYLFTINSRRVQAIIEKKSKEVLGKKITPHVLRHSIASYLNEKGMDISGIKEFLGHSSINTTQVYLHINKKKLFDDVFEALEK